MPNHGLSGLCALLRKYCTTFSGCVARYLSIKGLLPCSPDIGGVFMSLGPLLRLRAARRSTRCAIIAYFVKQRATRSLKDEAIGVKARKRALETARVSGLSRRPNMRPKDTQLNRIPRDTMGFLFHTCTKFRGYYREARFAIGGRPCLMKK